MQQQAGRHKSWRTFLKPFPLTAAQKRYLGAIKGLAEVRRLALPVLQVNIAKKQVNIATNTAVT